VVARTVCALRRHIVSSRQSERRSLIPTMGALPGSHVALIAALRADSHRVVVSIFVNPKQSAPGEDLATYRTAVIRTRMPGGVRVVWEGRRRETSLYPDHYPIWAMDRE
jgi:pantothenate synthetase